MEYPIPNPSGNKMLSLVNELSSGLSGCAEQVQVHTASG